MMRHRNRLGIIVNRAMGNPIIHNPVREMDECSK
jgi:hypothetical protein